MIQEYYVNQKMIFAPNFVDQFCLFFIHIKEKSFLKSHFFPFLIIEVWFQEFLEENLYLVFYSWKLSKKSSWNHMMIKNNIKIQERFYLSVIFLSFQKSPTFSYTRPTSHNNKNAEYINVKKKYTFCMCTYCPNKYGIDIIHTITYNLLDRMKKQTRIS